MAAPSDIVTIGEISYRQDDLIAYGSHGTLVFRGMFQKRKVAVKKIPTIFADMAETEKELLLRIDVHPNIVRYYNMERDRDGYYIALMLCDYTLMEYVKPNADNFTRTPMKLLREVTTGLHFLHENNIIHRDLKPLNILISFPNHKNERKAMISDFGISKETLGTRDSVTLTSRRGTDGFTAPEVFTNVTKGHATVRKTIDIFALGCIYFYVFSKGEQIFHSTHHVYDEEFYKICTGRFYKAEQVKDYCSLILRMISRNAESRPTCDQILFHYIYWTFEKKMQFLQAISEFLETNEQKRIFLDKASHEIVGNWIDIMSDNIISDLVNGKRNQGKKFPKYSLQENARNVIKKYYDGTKISSLIRAIRNICTHYDDIIVLAKEEIPSTEGLLQYCWKLFPKLFSFVYDTAENWCSDQSIAKFYFQQSDNVGQIKFQLEPKIKSARNGSKLYKGQYKDIKVAVKMYTPDLVMLGRNQWELLQNTRHRNIVQLHHKEEINGCMYIASELGQYNLFEYVQNYWNNDNPVPVQLLRQITIGLKFLHAKKIVHCDLTPANILISYPKEEKRRAMIADFESSHFDGRTSVINHNTKKLSEEWMAPELKDPQRKVSVCSFTIRHIIKAMKIFFNFQNESSDIYSLGCIYMYVLSNGNQIFGQVSGVEDKAFHIQCITESITTAGLQCYNSLLCKMLEYSENLRPTCYEILQHPMFWGMKRKVDFIKSVMQQAAINESAMAHLLSTPGDICNDDWTLQVNEDLIIDLGNHLAHNRNTQRGENQHKRIMAAKWAAIAQYGSNKLSAIINTMIKIDLNYNMIQKSRSLLEELHGGFIEYFIDCFPEIPDFIYSAMSNLKDEQKLQNYYGTETKCEGSNLDTRILQSILSKILPKCYKNCSQISKHWMESEREFYTSWMKKNCNNWTESSFRNAMKNDVNCKEICWKSSKEWKSKPAPDLIKEIETTNYIYDITISNDGTMLAVCSGCNITIYDSKDLSLRFSRDFRDECTALYFNGTDSCMLVATDHELHTVKIAEKLSILYTVKCKHALIARPWCADNIFLSGNYHQEKDETTFYLNKFTETENTDNENTQCLMHMVKGQAEWGKFFQMNSCSILIYKIGRTKLMFKTVSKIELQELENEYTLTPDQEVDCQGEILDFNMVPGENMKKLYILTEMHRKDYCFLTFDLDSFKLKTSTLLVPYDLQPIAEYFLIFIRAAPPTIHFVSNDKYIACGSGSKCTYVWELKSGLCIAQLKNQYGPVLCAIHPIDHNLVITAGDRKMKIWRLNTFKAIL